MPKEPEVYESYPISTVIIFNAVVLVNYIIGFYILSLLGLVWGVLFVGYLLFLEYRVYREGCVNCYYYGKRCMSGRGTIAPVLFKKGEPKKFCERKVTKKDLVPLILAMVFPAVGGAILLLGSLSFFILGLVVVPWIIWFLGNPLIYGKLACPHCKQGRICCPANDFFGKKS